MTDFISADLTISAEEHILSCILLSPEAIEKAKALPPEAFTQTAHQLIFRAMLMLHERGDRTDLLSVTNYLHTKGNLINVGGKMKLAALLDRMVPIALLDDRIKMLERDYQRRLLSKIQANLTTLENIPDALAQLQALQSNQGGKRSILKEAAQKARYILQSNRDELTINIELEAVREECKMSSYDWEKKIIKPLKRDLEADRFKLELLGLLQIDDTVERIRQQALLAPKYQMSSSLIEKAMSAMKQRTQTPESRALDLDELFDLESEGLSWVVPGLLPQKETIVLAGAPKAGKTLLAIDAAYAVATGESCFLGEVAKRGKVLLVSTDESANSTKTKLINRGFRRRDRDFIKVLPTWDITQMGALEALLEDFRPDLVVIDSLRRINKGSEISENSAEFADAIYTLKETLERYGASGILIHHTNKDREALGVHRLRGSSAIAGAVWGTWQLDHIPKPDPNNNKKLIIDPKDPTRTLSVFARDIEGQSLTIKLNPEDSSWANLGEPGEDEGVKAERETIEAKIIRILEVNTHLPGLSGKEIIELISGDFDNRSIYNQLSRMEAKRIVSSKPAPGDKRYKIYSLPNCHTQECLLPNCHTQKISLPPPSPTPTVPSDDYYAESLTTYSLENSHQNSHHPLKISHHPGREKTTDDYSNTDAVRNSEIVITSEPERGGEGVKEFISDAKLSHSVDELVDNADSSSPVSASIAPKTQFKEGDRVMTCDGEGTVDGYHEGFKQYIVSFDAPTAPGFFRSEQLTLIE